MIVHVSRRYSHRLDRFVERHTVYTVACKRQLCGCEGTMDERRRSGGNNGRTRDGLDSSKTICGVAWYQNPLRDGLEDLGLTPLNAWNLNESLRFLLASISRTRRDGNDDSHR
jgi:hypothetical protein